MLECFKFASVLSLAHRRFRTEEPGSLLAETEPKGKGKGEAGAIRKNLSRPR